MGLREEEKPLKRVNLGDLLFMRDFLSMLHGQPSLSEAARRLGISGAGNLHHRLSRVLRALGDHPPVNVGTTVTPEGRELEVVLHEVLSAAEPLFSAKSRAKGRRRKVRLAMPEVMTGRSFTELLRRIHMQTWADELELVTRRLEPSRLLEVRDNQVGRDHLVVTLSRAEVLGDATRRRRRARGGTTGARGADLRRVLMVLNNDDLVRAARPGSWPDAEALRGRPVYLPPRSLWPGFPEQRLGPCIVHRVDSFARAHSHALVGRRALAAAHPELLDEVEDRLCDTIPLGADAGTTRLELHRCPGRSSDPLVDKVYELIADHLDHLGEDAERADEVNKKLSKYCHVAYVSDAPDDDRRDPGRGAADRWRWRHASLSNFHVTSLGHLKGRHQPIDPGGASFHLTGRIMHGKAGWNHILWDSEDDETGPGDHGPRVEHYSVNLIFDDARLADGRPLVGLWSGRISGLEPWEPGCGAILVATEPLTPEELEAERRAFQARLHFWAGPLDREKSIP